MESENEVSFNTREVLDKSLKLLENAWGNGSKHRGTHSSIHADGPFNESRMDGVLQSTRIKYTKDSDSNINLFDSELSLTMMPGEFKMLADMKASNNKSYISTFGKSAQDRLFEDFMDSWQKNSTNEHDVLRSILDFIQCCTDALDLIRNSDEKAMFRTAIDNKRFLEIQSERNTWKLIYSLYQDRILSLACEEDMDDDIDLEKTSEKEIMERLYKQEGSIREWQLVIDWLEGNACEEVAGTGLEGFTDKAVAWENTLHELQNKRAVPYRSTREFITELDPDAPRRQNKHLHDMDQDDDDRLTQQVLKEIRCGKLDYAQSLCIHSGQPWRASILEGWKLYHDPNYSKLPNPVYRDPSPVEGNPNRDIWKVCAWRMCEDGNMPLKARAAVAAYCGHLPTLLAVSSSWEDNLWSYLKTLVDIRVEREIRTLSYKTYVEMPPAYWNNEVSVESIFNEITAFKDPIVRKEALAPDHIVQKSLIMDNIPQLMESISKWTIGSDMSVGGDSEPVSPHFLRFLTHLILFLRQIGRADTDSIGDSVIESYVKLLIEKKECKLVACYVSQLSQDDQIYYYSSFLEEITEPEERDAALKAAVQAGLNVDLITKTVVENIRQQPCNVDNIGIDIQDVSSEDWLKISALDWLKFYPEQRIELVVQANALIAFFLASGNVLAARMAYNKVPEGTIGEIQPSQSPEEDNFINIELDSISKSVGQASKEFLCYKLYLDADESFSDWFQHFHHAKPVEPILQPGYTFIEKVGFQHKYNQYKIDLERWTNAMENQTATTKVLLFNVLTFPLGWLVDDTEPDDPDRTLQMNALRSVIIPKVTLLLHLVMHSMGDFGGCVALSDIIASQHQKLYKVFSKQRLQDLLQKVAESSLALMNEGKDSWGFPPN